MKRFFGFRTVFLTVAPPPTHAEPVTRRLRPLRQWLALLVVGLAPVSGFGQDNETEWINPGTGDFTDPANWSNGLPTNVYGDAFFILNGGTAELTSPFGPSIASGFVGMSYAVYGGPSVSGPGTLTISGAGALTYDFGISFGSAATGTLNVINGGTLTAGTAGVLGLLGFNPNTSFAITVSGSGSRWDAGLIWAGKDGSGTFAIDDSGAVVASELVQAFDAGSVASTTVTNHGTLTASVLEIGREGHGTLGIGSGGRVIAGTATFGSGATGTGILNLNAGGTLALGGTDGLVAGAGTVQLNLNGGTLEVTGSALTSSADFNLAAATSHFDTNSLDATLSGSLSGTGGLIKVGEGTLTLTGDNIYSGATTVQLGTLALSGATARLDDTSSLLVGENTSATVSVSGGASLSSTGAITLGNATNGDFALAGTLDVSGASSSLAAASLSVGDTSTGIFNVSDGAQATISGDLKFGTQNAVTFFPVFTNYQGNGSGTITGTGSRLDVTGNLYSGYYSYGALSIEAGAVAAVGGSVSVGDQRGTIYTTGALTVTGTGSRLEIGADLIVGNGNVATFSVGSGGQVEVAGSVVVGKETLGAGTLNLNAGGTLVVGGDDGLAHGSGVGTINFAGGTLRVGDSDLTSSAPITLAASSASTIDTAGLGATFSGVLSGAGGLTKSGAGTLTLTGSNTYTGATTVEAGTLVVNGSLADTATTVAAGAMLAGDGTFGGLTTLAGGAYLAPGNSPGTMTFTDGLTLEAGSILDFELGTISDLIAVTGGVLTGPSAGTVTLNLFDAGGFAAATYVLFDFTGATPSGFEATDFTLGTTISGYDYAFNLTGSSLELVATASAIPEPGTYALLAGATALALALIRRRQLAAPKSDRM